MSGSGNWRRPPLSTPGAIFGVDEGETSHRSGQGGQRCSLLWLNFEPLATSYSGPLVEPLGIVWALAFMPWREHPEIGSRARGRVSENRLARAPIAYI